MANSILVLGNSGEGKTTSLLPNPELGIIGLDPKETFIINVKGKPLPARGWKNMYKPFDKVTKEGNMISTTNPQMIMSFMSNIVKSKPEIKNIVLDDSNYIMTEEYMHRTNEKSFDKFTDIAKNMFDIINTGVNLPDHINFILMAHTEVENGLYKLKTVGKLLDSQINPIGFFTYCLVSSTNTAFDGKTEYGYYTNATRDDKGIVVPAKTPYGVFDNLIIKNDLGYVVKQIENYNNGEQ